MSRQTDLATIHIAKKELNMDEDTYRQLLFSITGERSSAKLDFHQRMAVINRMNKMGFIIKSNKTKGPASQTKATQGDKIRALWIDMAKLNIVRDGSENALRTYIKRMTKNKYQAPQFCDAATANRIIETLKKWRYRALKERTKQ